MVPYIKIAKSKNHKVKKKKTPQRNAKINGYALLEQLLVKLTKFSSKI